MASPLSISPSADRGNQGRETGVKGHDLEALRQLLDSAVPFPFRRAPLPDNSSQGAEKVTYASSTGLPGTRPILIIAQDDAYGLVGGYYRSAVDGKAEPERRIGAFSAGCASSLLRPISRADCPYSLLRCQRDSSFHRLRQTPKKRDGPGSSTRCPETIDGPCFKRRNTHPGTSRAGKG